MALVPSCPLLVGLLLFSLTGVLAGQQIQENQVDLLVNILKPGFDPEGRVLASWVRGSDCTQWLGLTCNSAGSVTQISLPMMGLKGKIPESITQLPALSALNFSTNSLSGPIPSILGTIPDLESLDLGHNNFNGTIPSSLFSLTFLAYLDLSFNNLSGPVGNLSRLPYLEHLDLSGNSLNGTFPLSVESLPALTFLDMSSNEFTGEVFSFVTDLVNLTHLGLADLEVKSEIPVTLTRLTRLIYLDISLNALRGSIPSEIGALKNLVHLDLSDNRLTGVFVDSLSSLSSLAYLDLDNNTLSGQLENNFDSFPQLAFLGLVGNQFSGPLPDSLFSLSNLQALRLGSNLFTGSIPDYIKNFKNLEYLDLGSNNFSGSIPSSIGDLSRLTYLNLENNNLEGTIPSTISQLTNLEILILSYNALNGTIPDLSPLASLKTLLLINNDLGGGFPSYLPQLSALETIFLDHNLLGGELPGNLSSLPNITFFSCASCNLSGSLPSDITSGPNLFFADLSANRLTGSIPEQVLTSANTVVLDLSDNLLAGPIPDSFTADQKLQYLFLRANKLSGSLPLSLARLPNLEALDLGGNRLTGGFPPIYGILGGGRGGSMVNMSLESNLLEGTLPAEIGNLTKLMSLELNNNSFTSTLPVEIGQLTELVVMDLSNNSFFGAIPATYSNLTKLKELSMSACGLSKVIPDFSRLTSLVKLDLSYNRLEGPLPSLPTSGNLLTLDLHSNFLTGNISFQEGSLARLQALILGNNFLEGPIPASMGPAAPDLAVLSLVSNELTTPVPQDLLSRTTLSLQLYQNFGICSTATPNNSLWIPCQPPSTLQYVAAQFCPTLDCNNNNTANPAAFYSSTPTCVCAAPLTATIVLESPVFVKFTANTSARLEMELAKQLQLEVNQVLVVSATPYGGFGQILQVAFFPLSGRLSEGTISEISSQLQNITLSFYLGPAHLLLLTDPAPPSTIGVPPVAPPSRKGGGPSVKAWVVVLIVVGALVVVGGGGFWILLWLRPAAFFGIAHLRRQTSFALRVQDHFVKSIPLELVRASTDDFNENNILGSGGYGTVYKGAVPTGQMWAVKRAKTITEKGLTAFQNEVDVMSKMSHANLVRLLGYCDEENEQILIYDFLPNGSLRGRLKKSPEEIPPLTFEQRIDIALGSAEGLRYLHTFAKPTIIHRDVKSENILLDANWQAKIADFGLLKDNPLGGLQDEAVNTRLAGTPGYIDPQYYSTFQVTAKSDVYSFGVVLLELITGRGPLLRELPSSPNASKDSGGIIKLCDWVDLHHFEEYVDPNLEYPPKLMGGLLELAFRCLEERSVNRPDMEEVALTLGQIKVALREESQELVKLRLEEKDNSQVLGEDESGSRSAPRPTPSPVTNFTSAGNFETAPLISTLKGR